MMKRAQEKGLFTFKSHDLRDWTHDKYRRADDAPYGGGQGMVMKCEPIFEAVESLRTPETRVVFMGPCGRRFDQRIAQEYSGFGRRRPPHHPLRPLRRRGPARPRPSRGRRNLRRRLRADQWRHRRRRLRGRHRAPHPRRPRRRRQRDPTTASPPASSSSPTTRARPSFAAGKSPTSCSAATTPTSNAGAASRPSNAPASAGRICCRRRISQTT